MSKILVIILITASSIILSGCSTFSFSSKNVEWILPEKPKKFEVNSIPLYKDEKFVPSSNGIFLDEQSANNLMYNIDELDSYIEKQEALIRSMKRYYKAK
jgi:hypothetical protein